MDKFAPVPMAKSSRISVNAFYRYIPTVATCRKLEAAGPGLGELLRFRRVSSRLHAISGDWECLALLRRAREAGILVEDMKRISSSHHNWWEFSQQIDAAIAVRDSPNGL